MSIWTKRSGINNKSHFKGTEVDLSKYELKKSKVVDNDIENTPE